METWRRTKGVYDTFNKNIFDYDKEGASHRQFHPSHLPARHELLAVAEMASESDYNQNAQRTWSRIVHHTAWLRCLSACRQVSTREAVRFIAVSQPHAGDFLNAIPKQAVFRINTCDHVCDRCRCGRRCGSYPCRSRMRVTSTERGPLAAGLLYQ